MRILFDQGTPAPLRFALSGHTVTTAYELGWDQLNHGDLLKAAENSFDIFVTTDKNLVHQQNLAGRKLAILILPTTSWPRIQIQIELVVGAVNALRAGEFELLRFP